MYAWPLGTHESYSGIGTSFKCLQTTWNLTPHGGRKCICFSYEQKSQVPQLQYVLHHEEKHSAQSLFSCPLISQLSSFSSAGWVELLYKSVPFQDTYGVFMKREKVQEKELCLVNLKIFGNMTCNLRRCKNVFSQPNC